MTRQNNKPTEPYESQDFSMRTVLTFAVVLGLLILLVLWAMDFALEDLQHGLPPDRTRVGTSIGPPDASSAPPSPTAALQRQRDEEDRVLTQFAWVSRPEGVVQIPVALAMERFLAEMGSTEPQAPDKDQKEENHVPD